MVGVGSDEKQKRNQRLLKGCPGNRQKILSSSWAQWTWCWQICQIPAVWKQDWCGIIAFGMIIILSYSWNEQKARTWLYREKAERWTLHLPQFPPTDWEKLFMLMPLEKWKSFTLLCICRVYGAAQRSCNIKEGKYAISHNLFGHGPYWLWLPSFKIRAQQQFCSCSFSLFAPRGIARWVSVESCQF